MSEIAICWLRRDLRLEDNAALYHALRSGQPVLPLFIFDTEILDELEDKHDARVEFLYNTCQQLKAQLESMGSSMLVRYGKPAEIWSQLLKEYSIKALYTNEDWEPYALKRDAAVRSILDAAGVAMYTYKDHVIFDKDEVLKDDGTPYTVFTPYSRKWKKKLDSKMAVGEGSGSYYLQSYPTEKYFDHFYQTEALPMLSLNDMGFKTTDISIPDKTVTQGLIKSYDETRNFPGIKGTSQLGIHFRFGTISIREKARKAAQLNETYLNELIWRDFYSQILGNFPHVVGNPFRAKYDFIDWRNKEAEFEKWCAGETGYPIVDAGMRELNNTGY
ncbi:MAG: deoxyribodipyrimidine photo-lyase, partial [Bacteroidota bacterium]